MRNVILVLCSVAAAVVLAVAYTVILQTSFEPSRDAGRRFDAVLARQFGIESAAPRTPPVERYQGPFDTAEASKAVGAVWNGYDEELRRRDARAADEFGTTLMLAVLFFLAAVGLTLTAAFAVLGANRASDMQ
jgi:hypothetical protein